MATGDKNLEYRLIIHDDGTATVKRVSSEVEKLGKTGKTAGKAGKEGLDEIGKGATHTAEKITDLERTLSRIQRTVAAFIGVWAFRKVTEGFSDLIGTGIEYNSIMEQTRLGIASILLSQGEYSTQLGQTLEGQEALNAAQLQSSQISRQLQLDNLKTIATYQQLVKAYQQTLAPGLEVGFSPEKVRQYTVAMVQAAGAMGLNMDMLAEETRSMLRGTINPRNTLIATALGIRPEDINKYKGDTEAFFQFLMGKLSAFQTAGIESQQTWTGVISNVKDVVSITLGEGFRGLFDELKQLALDFQKSITIETPTGIIIDPEVINKVRELSDFVILIVRGLVNIGRGFAWLLDLSDRWGKSLQGSRSDLEDMARLATQVATGGEVKIGTNAEDWEKAKAIIGYIWNQSVSIGDKFSHIASKAKEAMTYMADLASSGAFSKSTQAFSDYMDSLVKRFDKIKRDAKLDKQQFEMPSIEWQDQPTYTQRLAQLTEDQIDALIKMRLKTGQITDDEKKRVQVMLEEADIQRSINELTFQEQASLVEVSRTIEKLKMPPIFKREFIALATQALREFGATSTSQVIGIRSQIASINKDYEEQIRLSKLAGAAEIAKLDVTHKAYPKLVKAMQDLSDARTDALGRQAIAQVISWQEEIARTRASIAEMTGDLDSQSRYESRAIQLAIERRVVTKELKGEYGKQLETLLKLASVIDQIQKKERIRLDNQSAVLKAQGELAGLTGDFYKQMELLEAENQARKEALDLDKKMSFLTRERLKNIYDEVTATKIKLDTAQFEYEAVVKRVGLQKELTTLQKGSVSAAELQRSIVQAEVDLWKKKLEVAKDPTIQQNIREVIKLLGQVGIEREKQQDTQNFLSAFDRVENFKVQIAEMTGNVSELETAYKMLAISQKAAFENDPAMEGWRETLGEQVDKLAELQKRYREFGRAQTEAQYKSNIAQSLGDWQALKSVEEELLSIEYKRAVAIGGLTETAQNYAKVSYDLKMREIEAQRTLNDVVLATIGLEKYGLQVTSDVAQQYENIFPNIINMTSATTSTFLTDLATGTKGVKDAWNDLFKNLHQGLVNLLVDLGLTIAKMELMKSLGYGGSPGVGAGGGGWGSLITSLASMALSAYGGGAGAEAITADKYSAWAGGVGVGGTKLGEGGVITSPQIAMVGETPEVFIPLKGGKVPVSMEGGQKPTAIQHFNFNIYTPDANSFRASQKQIMTQAFIQASRATGRNS